MNLGKEDLPKLEQLWIKLEAMRKEELKLVNYIPFKLYENYCFSCGFHKEQADINNHKHLNDSKGVDK